MLLVGGNLLGLAAAVVTGYLVKATGNFTSALALSGLATLTGAVMSFWLTRTPIRALDGKKLAQPIALNYTHSNNNKERGSMATVRFTLNGNSESVDVVPEMPLLWVLRDTLGRTGTKFGCGAGLCGACTVILNDQPVRSCVTPIRSVEAKHVTTIEGLSAQHANTVQQAWIAEDVPQCGYCQPGQIMNAVALLRKAGNPSDRDIDEAMRGNICRCGTYDTIRRAIHRAARGAK
jgi:isoquinoline 1-oxidoreductase alpha subunit